MMNRPSNKEGTCQKQVSEPFIDAENSPKPGPFADIAFPPNQAPSFLEFGQPSEASSLLEDTIMKTWLPKLGEEGVDPVQLYREMRGKGEICCKEYTAEELRMLNNSDGLRWKEGAHYAQVLERISLPLDPARSLAGRGDGPVIFVRIPGPYQAVFVINGNHRTGKVVHEQCNPANYPLQVLEFSSPDAYERMVGVSISEKQYIDIQIEQGDRALRRPK